MSETVEAREDRLRAWAVRQHLRLEKGDHGRYRLLMACCGLDVTPWGGTLDGVEAELKMPMCKLHACSALD